MLKGLPLNTIPFKNLKIGDRVISATGRLGKITKLDEQDDNTVVMEWDDDVPGKHKVSSWYHHQLDMITYLGAAK